MTHRRRIFTLGLGLAALSSLVACDEPHGYDAAAPLPAVDAELATSRTLEIPSRITVRGVVEADMSAAITSRVTAMVTAVRAVPGDRVQRRQVLLEIDPSTARGQVSQATGALAQAQAALALAERNYERFQALADTNAASELELDMARMQYEQARGAVEQANGAVQAAESVAAESRVRAPFDGLVVERMVDVGDLAAPGRPLMMIESEAGKRLVLAVPASVLTSSSVAVGDVLEVTLDNRSDLGAIAATVIEMSPAADPVTHSFKVEVELPDESIATGSSGRATILGTPRSAVVVPRPAVLRQGGLTLVVVRGENGKSASRIVTTGDVVGDGEIEILSGLSGGETVLVGLPGVPPNGSPVEEVR
jgi:RND family efflux transporter MFP subunit